MGVMDQLFSREPDILSDEGWEDVLLHGGEVLWCEGDPASALAWVRSGALEIVLGDQVIDSIEAGQLVGEASAFCRRETRLATVRALTPTRLWVMEGHNLARLRGEEHPSYDVLLDRALASLAARIECLDARILERIEVGLDGHRATLRPPEPQVVERQAPGPQGERGTPSGTPSPTPPSPKLSAGTILGLGQEERATEQLAAVLEPVWLQRGEILCRQGQMAGEVFVVASGMIAAEREGLTGRNFLLAQLPAGSLVGTSAVVNGGQRSATLSALEDGWVYKLSRSVALSLPPEVVRLLKEALVRALRVQLLGANSQSNAALGPKGTLPLDEALSVMGGLQGITSDGPGFDLALGHLPPREINRPGSEREMMFSHIRDGVIGADRLLETPFGRKRLVYADYTASGRSLRFIEEFICDRVLPLYANTHTEASASGLQTTRFREEARELVARSVGASDEDAVIFVGSGATGAINKLIDIMGLRVSSDVESRYQLRDSTLPQLRPAVFIGPYEHHSNILPWRHSLADVYVIPLDEAGQIDLSALAAKLVEMSDRPLRIGSFSAASNVTGIATDVRGVSELLHAHGALSFWDYAAAGPYVDIEMNPEDRAGQRGSPHKDAIFISPHKFVGGPGTPGVLVVKRHLVKNAVPTQPGGGTVDFVTVDETVYTDNIEHREEAGTPAIVESIRAGLVFQLKDQVGVQHIEARESSYVGAAIAHWIKNPAIRIIGNPNLPRLSITSFMLRYGPRFLHYNFVIALLNDLFGLQARGGCSCAGPYGAMLLGLTDSQACMFMDRAQEGFNSVKPGWARVNFNYFISETEFQYIVSAVDLVARYGWALLPDYRIDPHSGLWSHRDKPVLVPETLSSLRLGAAGFEWNRQIHSGDELLLDAQLADARRILKEAVQRVPGAVPAPDVPERYHAARWFPLPCEVAEYLRQRNRGSQALRPSAPQDGPLQPSTIDPAFAPSV